MAGWASIAQKKSPEQETVLEEIYRAFLCEKLGSLEMFRTLLFLEAAGFDSSTSSIVAQEVGIDKSIVIAHLERLTELGLVNKKFGILGSKWIYNQTNLDSIMVFNLKKMWNHPRIRNFIELLFAE